MYTQHILNTSGKTLQIYNLLVNYTMLLSLFQPGFSQNKNSLPWSRETIPQSGVYIKHGMMNDDDVQCKAMSLLDLFWFFRGETLRIFSDLVCFFVYFPFWFLSFTSSESTLFFITAGVTHFRHPDCLLISLWELPCCCKILILCLSDSEVFVILNGMMWHTRGLMQ